MNRLDEFSLRDAVRKADEAWQVWKSDQERMVSDAEALERLGSAWQELKDRFGSPIGESTYWPEVVANPRAAIAAAHAIFEVFKAGGTWVPPEMR